MKKKIISSILSLAMLLSLLPVAAFAGTEDAQETTAAVPAIFLGVSNTGTAAATDIKAVTNMTASVAEGDESAKNILWFIMTGLEANAQYTLSMKNSSNAEVLTDKAISYTETGKTFTAGASGKAFIYVSLNEFNADGTGQGSSTALGEGGAFTVTATKKDATTAAVTGEITLTKSGSDEITWTGKQTPHLVGGFGWTYSEAQDSFNAARTSYGKAPVTDCLDQTVWVLCAGLDFSKTYTLVAKNGDDELFKVENVQATSANADKGNPTPGYSWSYLHTAPGEDAAQNSENVLAKAGTITFTLTENGGSGTSGTAVAEYEYTVTARTDPALTGDVTVTAGAENVNPTVTVPDASKTKLMGRYYVEVYQNGEIIGHAVTEAEAKSTPTCSTLGAPIAFTLDQGKEITADSDYGVKIYAAKTDNTNQNVVLFEAGETEAVEKVTVTFNANGGTGDVASQKVAKGETLTEEQIAAVNAAVSKTGYALKGWAKTAEGDVIDLTTETFSADTTLYAVWEIVTIKSAVLQDSEDAKVTTATVTIGTAANGEADITIDGIIPAAGTYTLSYTRSDDTNGTVGTLTVSKNATTEKPEMADVTITDAALGVSYTVKLASTAELLNAGVLVPDAAPPTVDTGALTQEQAAAIESNLNAITGTVAPDAGTNNNVSNALAEATKAINSDSKVQELLDTIEDDAGAGITANDYNAVQAVTYLEIKATDYVPSAAADGDTPAVVGSITLEITPKIKYQAVKVEAGAVDTKVTPVDVGAPENAALPTDAESIGSVEITFTVPAGFISNAGDPVYVAHKGYIYTATWDTNHYKFTNPHGFSEFVIYAENPAEAKISTTEYVTLQDAVKAIAENGTIELLKNPATKTITDVGVTFKLQVADANAAWLTAITATAVSGKTVTKGDPVSADGNTTVTFTVADAVTPPTPSTPSGGGGGVSSNVTIDRPTNGKVTVTPTAPSKGATVTINLTPDTGYAVGTVTVTDKDGKAVELTKVNDTKYTFVMPDGKVTVKATFTKTETPPATGFTDVAADAYYADAVKWAVEKGITNGLTATTFGPNNSCTRGQMVTFLWRAAGSPAATGTNSFSDVASGEYYYNAVLWAVEKGITNGTSATTFSPNATVNRGQTVTFLYRYAESPAATGDTSFTDVTADAFYADAVKWAVAEEITNGTSSTTFSPASNCTRGQIVTFMYRQMAE